MTDTNNSSPPPSAEVAVRAAWSTAKPERRDFGTVATELNSIKLLGEGNVFEKDFHGPVTHMRYFMPPSDVFLFDLRLSDCRSANEWNYINAAGVWTALALAALQVAKGHKGDLYDFAWRPALAYSYFKAVFKSFR